MGVSTNGQLCFGISFEEETEFPWGEQEIEEWWIDTVCGFKPSVTIYDSEGQYLNGERPSDAVMKAYFAELQAFKDAHPLPVEVVIHCSYDSPMYILAVTGTEHSARRGYPEAIDPSALVVTADQIEALKKFCVEYDIEIPGEPCWYLSSLWG
jgi:hypothetical protein